MNMSPFEKEQDIHSKLLNFILKNPGLTTTDIQKDTGISRKTLEKHLSVLMSENEIHMNQYGPTRVYTPNKKIKNFKTEKLEIGNKLYYLDLLENQYGKFYLIQEKKKDNNKLMTKGSILIPEANIKEFMKKLNNLIN